MMIRIAKSLAVLVLMTGTSAMAQVSGGISGGGVSGVSGLSGVSGGLAIDFAAGNVNVIEKDGGLASAIDAAFDGESNKANADCGNKLRCDD